MVPNVVWLAIKSARKGRQLTALARQLCVRDVHAPIRSRAGRRRVAISGNVGPKPIEANEFATAVNNQSQQLIAGALRWSNSNNSPGRKHPHKE